MNTIIAKTTSKDSIYEMIDNMYEDLQPEWYRLSRHDFTNVPQEYADLMIRWGCTASIGTDCRLVYNKAEGIRLASNKGKCRDILYQNNIAVPEPVDLTPLLRGTDWGVSFPLVVRPTFHQKGKNFLLFNNFSDFMSGWQRVSRLDQPYASRFYPKTTEYRVHIAHGKVLIVQQKLQTSVTNGENWSHGNGYSFEVVGWKQYRKDIVDLAVKTIEVLGLDFGAVDIMADPLDSSLPKAVVCEVNTSPRLEGYTAERYAEYFDWLIQNKETRHFDIPEGLSARHYAFKHRELQECDYDLNFKE